MYSFAIKKFIINRTHSSNFIRLQIFHDRGDHWITASNMNVESGLVVVYDSVYCRLDPITKDAIVKKFQFDSSKPPDVKLVKFGKQKGSSDCVACLLSLQQLQLLLARSHLL